MIIYFITVYFFIMTYKVEFDDNIEYYNNEHSIIEPYWLELSKFQIKRHNKVLHQLRNNWHSVYNTLNTMSNYTDDETVDFIMNKIYRLYFNHSKANEEYYNQEKIIRRMNNKYISKKINKLKNKKYKI